MKDLSLHILDIVQNSVSARASKITITIVEHLAEDTLSIRISDNGKGMSPEVLERVTDPFFTSRTTRKVGLGIPLFKQNAELSGGCFSIESREGEGTHLEARFGHAHLDRPPLGDMPGVMMILVGANPDIHFIYTHQRDEECFVFDTHEVQEALDGMSLNEPAVIPYLKEMIRENLKAIQAL